MNRQTRSRLDGERRTRTGLIRLLCAVSIWRTAMTRVLPLCGASAWWTALICLLPGFLVAVLLRLTMGLTSSATLTEAVRACLGKAGSAAVSAVLTLLLVTDGVSSITALITLFTQGVGTRGTQLTLSVLTGVILLFSLHREGLARAAYFLRWIMAGAALLVAAFLAADAQMDSLFPLYGDGQSSVTAVLKAGVSLAWPVVLLLTTEPASGHGRLQSSILPALAAVGALFLLTLTIPHELLTTQESLASLLLLPTRFTPNAVRVVALSLLMLSFFLAIGASAQLATDHLCMPFKSVPVWLPYVLLGGMFLTQATDVSALWMILGRIEPWLFAPIALLALICLPIAFCRRNVR